jgi:DNA-binding beta-propeller fold protein YncE
MAAKRAALLLGVVAGCASAVPVYPRETPKVVQLGDVTAIHLPTGADITPRAAPSSEILELNPETPGHPEHRAAYAMSLALSPDGSTLALLTSGYNQLLDGKRHTISETRAEHVFFYDVTGGVPVQKQLVAIPNAFVGVAFAPGGDRLYVSGGADDSVHVLARDELGAWSDARVVQLGHHAGLGIGQSPLTAGVAVTASGNFVAVANHENDSLSILDERHNLTFEVDLRPGGGVAGGEYPLSVVTVGDLAYVTAQRDRELVEVDLAARRVTRRLAVGGPPVRVISSGDGERLYVTGSNSDDVVVVDRARFVVLERIAAGGPPGSQAALLRGANPNGLALAPDGSLWVSLGGSNALANVSLGGKHQLTGLVPTGFYPNDVAVSRDGKSVYAAYGKSPIGPSDGAQIPLGLMRGGLHVFPRPSGPVSAALTQRVLANEHTETSEAIPPVIAALRGKVRHVVYVIAENRTFDQVLGDMPTLDGDPKLVHWGAAFTPNQHALATRFSGFDRFFDSGGVSGDGWQWSTAAGSTDVAEKEVPQLYGGRGSHTYDWEGRNRGINVSHPRVEDRKASEPRVPDDPDLLPGTADVAAVDRPVEGGRGYLWDVAKTSGLRVRNYGFFTEDDAPRHAVREPHKTQQRMAYCTALGLEPDTDPYFRGFDMEYPDYWRVQEWLRELGQYEQAGDMPALELVRLPHDHFGAFARAIDGVDTVDSQMADHDYALGLLVSALSRSRFWSDTLVIALEDDAQDGADHVDAHRSVLYFAGGHAARGVVSHTRYTTPSVLRTLELLLGLPPLSRHDATAPPIVEALSETVDATPFEAVVPDVLRSTRLPLPPPKPTEHATIPRGDAAFWAQATATMRFDHEDSLDSAAFNALLYSRLVAHH